MKVSKAQAAENRHAIVDAAAQLYRARGLTGVGVADITRDAGLTHGGLYRHFESKEALAREACARAFDWSLLPNHDPGPASPTPEVALARGIAHYLSIEHRDHPGDGCPVAALGVDVARAGSALSTIFAQGVEHNIERFARLLEGSTEGPVSETSRERAIPMLAAMVGALVIARATAQGNPALSEHILASLRQHLIAPSPEPPAA